MSFWFDKTKKRWRIRIRRDGLELAETLPRGAGRAQAEERHAVLVRQHYAETKLGRASHTVAQALERLIDHHLPPRSGGDIVSHVAAIAAAVDLDRPLEQISDIAREYRRVARKHSRRPGAAIVGELSAATLNRRVDVLRRAANLAWREWHWLDRPVSIHIPRERGRNVRLDRRQIDRLAKACRLEETRRMVIVSGYTSIGPADIKALTEANLERDVVVFDRKKTGAPVRIPLVGPARRAIRPLPFAYGMRWLMKDFERARAAVGLPHVHFYDLRHSAASIMLDAGVPIEVISKILGHEDLRTTMRYLHLSDETAKMAMMKLWRG